MKGFHLKKKLMFIVNVDFFFISHRLPVALQALKDGYEVHIATGVTDGQSKLEECGLTVHELKLGRRDLNIFRNFVTFFQIFSVLYRVKPDILHLVSIKPVIFGGIAARIIRIPKIISALTGLGFLFIGHDAKAHLRKSLIGFCYRRSLKNKNNMLIFQNEQDRLQIMRIAKIPKSRTRLIEGAGVDLSKFCQSSVPKKETIFMLPARLYIEKGVVEFVEAAKIVKNEGYVARFVLVGSPDTDNPQAINLAQLDQWVRENGIEFWGFSQNMHETLTKSSVVVLPSYREGFPKVLMEAAACGRAVITTTVPGCSDAVRNEVTGILVPPRDAEALAQAMIRLIKDKRLAESMGRAGRMLAESKYDVDLIVAKQIDLYKENWSATDG